jgi:predicted component of type VI protein secretion system
MQAVLVMFRSDGERRSFSIARDMTVIGRREDCDLRIPLGEVSRKHCRLVRDGDTLKIEDLGSSNGTFLNGRRVQEAMLSPGDSIQVGPVVFVLQIDGVPADEELSPVTADAAAAAAAVGAGSGSGMAEAAEGIAGEIEELEPLEEAEAAEALEPAVGEAGGPAADDEAEALEPLEELEGLDQDFDISEEPTPASSASGELRIDLDADEKNR